MYADGYFGRGKSISYVSQPTWAEIAQVQSSPAQARGIGATGLGDGDGIEIETGIQ